MKRLSEKQQRFAEFYCGLSKGNATDAARRAGYKGNEATLASVGSENLRKAEVQRAIESLNAKVRKRAIKTSAEIQEFLSRIVDDDPALTEHELEFDVGGNPIIDPLKLTPEVMDQIADYERREDAEVEVGGGVRFRRARGRRPSVPPGLDVFFRRRLKASERRAAAMDLLRARGLLIENVLVKREGTVLEVLKGLKGEVSAAAYDEVLRALAKKAG